MKKFLTFLILLIAVFIQNTLAQNISNEGTDFWTVFPTHDPGSTLAEMNVNVTAKANSEVTVSCGNWSSGPTLIPANTVVTFVVPRVNSYIEYSQRNSILVNKGVRIQVTSGKPKVVAYSHVFAANRSAATLILPFDALGQKYFSMNYIQDNGGNNTVSRNFLTLIAVEDNTDIILTKRDRSELKISLAKKGDVYEYMPADLEDITGTSVEVDQISSPCKRFAAFSGSTSVTIGLCSRVSGRDPLLQQLYDINSWGKTYGVVPFINRRYIVRILAKDDNTLVKLDGNVIGTLASGSYMDQELTEATIISANNLISVAEYSFSQTCSSVTGGSLNTGDPEMVLLNPIEFNIKNITLFSSDRNLILEKYINVFMKANKTSTFKLNGVAPNGSWAPMPSDNSYAYIQIQTPVNETNLTLTADEGFNAIAYGFGQTESYAYSAGTNLYSTSTLSLVNSASNIASTTSACLGQTTSLKLTIPYELKKITWNFDDGSVFIDNLGAPPVIDNSGTSPVFIYTSINKVFNNPGMNLVSAIAELSPLNKPTCFAGSDIKFDFQVEVVPLATGRFTVPDLICAGTPVRLKDNSATSGTTITQWEWIIDNVTYNVPEPEHTFTRGSHTVKLRVANSSGCWSAYTEQTIQVNRDFPQLEFVNLKSVCITDNPIQVRVNEKLGLAAVKKEFLGKGITVSGTFDPALAGVGIHEISYTFTSSAGCTDIITQNIEVYATTVIDVVPTVYILAGGEMSIPASIVAANATYKYKYKWSPSTGLSNDAIINPIASPVKDTKYVLTVSIDGLCSVTREVLVKVLEKLDPPNAFSPNNDQVNDVWNVKSLDSYPLAEISIFNRNGQKVFTSIGYTKPFDGNYRGNPLPVGVYYYVIDPKNGRQKITGSLTIIR